MEFPPNDDLDYGSAKHCGGRGLPSSRALAKADFTCRPLGAFWLIVAGISFRYVTEFLGMGLFTAHRDQVTTLTNVVSVCVLIIAQVILLPITGLHGAGGAILITFAGMALWRYRLLFGLSLASPYSPGSGLGHDCSSRSLLEHLAHCIST